MSGTRNRENALMLTRKFVRIHQIKQGMVQISRVRR